MCGTSDQITDFFSFIIHMKPNTSQLAQSEKSKECGVSMRC